MPLLETKGAGSAQGYGEFTASAPKVYIEDVFSTYLYTGNNSTQTITNGIDLSTKGGLVWIKSRAGTYVREHYLYDTARGTILSLSTDNTGGNANNTPNGVSAYYNNGFNIVGSLGSGGNGTGTTYASWTFRKQPKFFDVVTYTGDGSNRTISHSLGSVPGCIIVKRTDDSADWQVYHRSLSNTEYLVLNTTAAKATGATRWNSTTATSTEFSLGTDATVNANTGTYVAYLFAHDAGGFGLSGTDNVISCGSFTTNGSGGVSVNLGYEPQWVFLKNTDAGYDSVLVDNMRGFPASGDALSLRPESSASEGVRYVYANATGFSSPNNLGANLNWIYIAIRRGPMKVPTSGTSVFSPNTSSSPGGTVITTGFPLDAQLTALRAGGYNNVLLDRLRGIVTIPYGTPGYSAYLATNTTGAEASYNSYSAGVNNTGFQIANTWADLSSIYYSFRRAPGFFDVVCYTGTGSATTFSHNLGVVPELMIVKKRNVGDEWAVYSSATGNTKYLVLNTTVAAATSSARWDNTSPTASVFTVGLDSSVNSSGGTYVAYLFATVAGVSKVGSYTGTGTTLQIDCGFTGGARFILIKRTDSTGDWYVYDSARGIVAGNDPYLFLNSTAAEVTNTDYVDTYNAGFELSSTAPAGLNANGGTFLFLAIA